MKSEVLYFIETTPQMEQIFNSYMDEAVNLYNEQFMAEGVYEWDMVEGLRKAGPVFRSLYLNQKWLEMVRDN